MTVEGRFQARTSATLDEEGRAGVAIPIPIRTVGTTMAPERRRTGFSWQLQATASVPGADYSGVFVLPIYDPPRARRWSRTAIAAPPAGPAADASAGPAPERI